MATMVITEIERSYPMITKSLIAAAAVAGSVLAASTGAVAKTNWDIHIGLGAPLFDVPVYTAPGYVYDYDYDYAPVRRYHRPVRRHYIDVEPDYGISCSAGKRALRSRGFHDVEAYDCSAPTFGYTAWRDGGYFKVRVNTRGGIISMREID
jgi:hypothetical protein